MSEEWYKIANEDAVASPAVLLYPNRIRENIQRMVAIAGDPGRLRPHVKTHKLPELIRMQLEAGIGRFKCATLSEAAMVAECGATDILIAYPLYGPAIDRLFDLITAYPEVRFSALCDNEEQRMAFEHTAKARGKHLGIFIDLNVGMDRTGIVPGAEAIALYRALADSPFLSPRGLHIYDGHLNMADPEQRATESAACFQAVQSMIDELGQNNLVPEELVCGGTPTFPIHAKYPERTLSPGTLLLWDWNYAFKFADLSFLHAAILLTRVVSKPAKNKLCLDLGHKAVASEMTPPRVHLLGIPLYEHILHSEEHLVVSFDGAEAYSAGDCLYGVPAHICPTMALHEKVWTVADGQAAEKWHVKARSREVSIL